MTSGILLIYLQYILENVSYLELPYITEHPKYDASRKGHSCLSHPSISGCGVLLRALSQIHGFLDVS